MSSSLTTKIRNMSLHNPSDRSGAAHTANNVPQPAVSSPLYEFPPIPDLEDAKNGNHYYFFAFPLTLDRLLELATAYLGPPKGAGKYRYLPSTGLYFLGCVSGYKHVNLVCGVAQAGDHVVDEKEYFPVTPGKGMTRIISVFVNKKELVHWRPTVEQMEKLEEVLGVRPRWYRDKFGVTLFNHVYEIK